DILELRPALTSDNLPRLPVVEQTTALRAFPNVPIWDKTRACLEGAVVLIGRTFASFCRGINCSAAGKLTRMFTLGRRRGQDNCDWRETRLAMGPGNEGTFICPWQAAGPSPRPRVDEPNRLPDLDDTTTRLWCTGHSVCQLHCGRLSFLPRPIRQHPCHQLSSDLARSLHPFGPPSVDLGPSRHPHGTCSALVLPLAQAPGGPGSAPLLSASQRDLDKMLDRHADTEHLQEPRDPSRRETATRTQPMNMSTQDSTIQGPTGGPNRQQGKCLAPILGTCTDAAVDLHSARGPLWLLWLRRGGGRA
ncbi:hypothetical protein BN1708_000897, partial [Verticillium longisporum]